MASAWGKSWGSYWGNSWGVIEEAKDSAGKGLYKQRIYDVPELFAKGDSVDIKGLVARSMDSTSKHLSDDDFMLILLADYL